MEQNNIQNPELKELKQYLIDEAEYPAETVNNWDAYEVVNRRLQYEGFQGYTEDILSWAKAFFKAHPEEIIGSLLKDKSFLLEVCERDLNATKKILSDTRKTLENTDASLSKCMEIMDSRQINEFNKWEESQNEED